MFYNSKERRVPSPAFCHKTLVSLGRYTYILNSLWRRVTNQPKGKQCDKNHRTRYAGCNSEVICSIPLSHGKVYIGQTGRCINDRAGEHATSLKTTPSGHLPIHCHDCTCTARIDEINIIRRKHNHLAREIIEALAIDKKGETCASTATITLTDKEKDVLRSYPVN